MRALMVLVLVAATAACSESGGGGGEMTIGIPQASRSRGVVIADGVACATAEKSYLIADIAMDVTVTSVTIESTKRSGLLVLDSGENVIGGVYAPRVEGWTISSAEVPRVDGRTGKWLLCLEEAGSCIRSMSLTYE